MIYAELKRSTLQDIFTNVVITYAYYFSKWLCHAPYIALGLNAYYKLTLINQLSWRRVVIEKLTVA
jgi:hypothetical protein